MAWKIVQQEEKRGKDKIENVDCKWVRFYPKFDQGVKVGSGMLGFILLRVDVEHPKGGVCSITWNDFCKGEGKFAFIYPETKRRPFLKEQGGKILRNPHGKEFEDLTKEEIVVKGEREEFYNHENFAKWLQKKIGVRCAVAVLKAWADRLEVILARKAEIAAEKGEKAVKAAKKAAKAAA